MDLSMKWFKDQIKKSVDRVVSVRVDTAVDQLATEEYYNTEVDPFEGEKPYRMAKLVNNILTVVLNDGSVLVKTDATEEDYDDLSHCQSEEDVRDLIYSEEVLKEQRAEEAIIAQERAFHAGIQILKSSDEFEFSNNSVYMKGVNRSIPQMLVEKFASLFGKYEGLDVVATEEYQALKKFWLKCCLNPNAKSAEDLYGFLQNHRFKIDKHGNFYAYRRVVSRENTNKELVEFVSNAYTKVKAVWKKKPSDYEVFNDGSGFVFVHTNKQNHGENVHIGNLQDLYLDLPNLEENRYTSAHTGQEDYRVGEVISMPRDAGDDNNNISCSKGFHAASKAYDYSGFGDTPILVIINPCDVLAVPKGEYGKLRTCRWFFATTLPDDEQYILDDEDFDVSELGNTFEEKCAEDLKEHVKNSFAEEVKRHTFTLSAVTSRELDSIVDSLDKMRDAIFGRVKYAEEPEEDNYDDDFEDDSNDDVDLYDDPFAKGY